MAETSRRSPSTQSRSDEQRVMLIAALMALIMVALVMGMRLGAWLLAPSPAISGPEVLPANDMPLLTPEQREEARRSGVAAFEFDGIWHVDRRVPEEYWTEWRS